MHFKSMEGKINVSDLKNILKNISNDYAVCLGGESERNNLSYIEIEIDDENKKVYVYAE